MILPLLTACVPGTEPRTASDWVGRGDELRAQGDATGAIAAYRQAVKLEPESIMAHLRLAQTMEETGELQESIMEYLRCIKLDPKLPTPYYALGSLLAEQEMDPVFAATCVETGLELDPDVGSYIPRASQLAATCVNKGVFLAQAEDYPAAIGYLELARLLDPQLALAEKNLAAAYNNYGVFLGRQGDLSAAKRNFEYALETDPALKEAYNNLGVALGIEGRLQDAMEQFQHAIDIDPRFADAWNNMGVALAATGRFSQAQSHFAQALALATASDAYLARIPKIRANLDLVMRLLAGEPIDVSDTFTFEGYFGSPTMETDLHSFYELNQRQIEELITARQEQQCLEGMTTLQCQLECLGACAYNVATGCWECAAGEAEWPAHGVIKDYHYSGLLLLQVGERSELVDISGDMVLRFVATSRDEAEVFMEQASVRTSPDLDGDGVCETLETNATGRGTVNLRSGRIELLNHVSGTVKISSARSQQFNLSFPETGFYDFDSGVIYLTSAIFSWDLAFLTPAHIGICFSKVAEERGLKILDEKNRERLSAEWQKEYSNWEKQAISKADLTAECASGTDVTAVECVVKVKPVGMELLPFGQDTFDQHEKHKHIMQAGEDIMKDLGWVMFASDVGSVVSKGKLFKVATPQAEDVAESIRKLWKNYLQRFHCELWVTYDVEVYRRYTRFRCQDGKWVAELLWQEPEQNWTRARYLAHVAGSCNVLLGLQERQTIEEATRLAQSRAEDLAREIHQQLGRSCPQSIALPQELLVQNMIHARKTSR